jgi:hypothetical protein
MMLEASLRERVINVTDIDPRYRHDILFRLCEHLAPDDSLQINSYRFVRPANHAERAYLESLICGDFERCHPGGNARRHQAQGIIFEGG